MLEAIGKVLRATPDVIRAASQSAFALAAAVVVLLSVVALAFFSGGSSNVRLVAFFGLLVGLSLFVIVVTTRVNASKRGEHPPVAADLTMQPRPPRAGQAAAVCFRRRGNTLEFLLVRSSSGKRRVFPKGNVKEGEAMWAAAEREARQEAGVEGDTRKEPLTEFWHRRGEKQHDERLVAAYLLEATSRSGACEKGRDPRWYSARNAEKAVAENRDPRDCEELKRVLRLAVTELADP